MTTPPRRVALVTNGLTRAGAETQLVRLASALRAHGDDVAFVSILGTEAFGDELTALGIPVLQLSLRPRMRGLSAILAAARVLRNWRPDVVISFVYQANVVGRLGGRLAGVPVIISSVRNEHFGGRKRELLMRATDRMSTLTTTNSSLAAERLVQRGIVPRHRLVVIPNSIDITPFTAAQSDRVATRSALGIVDDRFVWLAAGRLEPQKDYPTLLAAFARCTGAGTPLRGPLGPGTPLRGPLGPGTPLEPLLLIAGQGRLRDDLERLATGLALGDSVQFLGVRTDVPNLVSACDGVVLSSRWEGLPNVVMEAMAGGRPVVATRAGGAPELVEDGATGRLVVAGAPGPLAEAMVEVMSASSSRRRAMGARGRAIVAERYSPAVVDERWLRLIDECESAPRHRDPR